MRGSRRFRRWWLAAAGAVLGLASAVFAGICPIPCRSVADSAIGRYFQAFMSSVIDPWLRDLEDRFEVIRKLRSMPGVFGREARAVLGAVERYDRRELPSYRVKDVRSAREAAAVLAEQAGGAALEAVGELEDALRGFSPSRFDLASSHFQVQKDAAKLALMEVHIRSLLLEQTALGEMARTAGSVKEEVR